MGFQAVLPPHGRESSKRDFKRVENMSIILQLNSMDFFPVTDVVASKTPSEPNYL